MADDLIDAMKRVPDPFVTAGEVANQVEFSKNTVFNRLDELAEKGRIEKKKVGGRAVVWWIPDAQGSDGS